MGFWSFGALEVSCRRTELNIWRLGGIEARCMHGNWRHVDIELWKLAAGVATWRHGGVELWSYLVAMYVFLRHGGIYFWSFRRGAQLCRCGDMKRWKLAMDVRRGLEL